MLKEQYCVYVDSNNFLRTCSEQDKPKLHSIYGSFSYDYIFATELHKTFAVEV